MKLIPEWRKGWKFYTTWFHAIGVVFSGVGVGIATLYGVTDSVQHSLLPQWLTYVIFLLIFVGAAIGRFIRQ